MTETDEKQTAPEYTEPSGPIVLNLKRKRKSKRRYSKGLEEIQLMDRHLTRASHRMARAVEKGIAKYRDSSTISAKKKQDGAIRDFIPNSGIAMSRALKEAYLIPSDIARAFDTKPMRRRARRQLRGITRTLRIWF
jgi:hypothetical protein